MAKFEFRLWRIRDAAKAQACLDALLPDFWAQSIEFLRSEQGIGHARRGNKSDIDTHGQQRPLTS
jgi:hypothetical protein